MRAFVGSLFVAATVLGCAAAPPLPPFEIGADTASLSEQERRLWTQAHEIDEQLVRSDLLYDAPALDAYLHAVIARLYPELADVINVRVLDSPILNAFALPNGSLYVHSGLLARMDNEAQLATVLGHEAGHFVYKHSARQQQNAKSAGAFAMASAMLGIPLLGDLVAISSIYGYSRDLEREADSVAYQRLTSAGYDVAESVKVFEHLYAETKALGEDEPVFFSSHPKLKERIESFSELIAGNGVRGGGVGSQPFLALTEGVRTATLEADRGLNRYQSLLLVLEDTHAAGRYPPAQRSYYLGEAYRLRAEEGDDERMRAAYEAAVFADPDFAPAQRALGLYYFKRGALASARPYLERYLELAPDAPDRGFITQYLERAGAAP